MSRASFKLPASLCFGLAVLACAGEEGGSQSANVTEAVVRQKKNEPLKGKAQRKLICEALAKSAGVAIDKCLAFKFVVKEVATSTQLLHAESGKPVTMELKVAVTGAGNETYDALLRRAIGDAYELKFDAQAAPAGSLEKVHAFIKKLADDVGEYADWNDGDVADRVKATTHEALPKVVRDKCDALLAKRRGPENDAQWADDDAFFQIRMVGETVGYVCNVYDYIDDPLWDGSGVHYYLDAQGNLVVEVEWTA
jgi:hypothetical protein